MDKKKLVEDFLKAKGYDYEFIEDDVFFYCSFAGKIVDVSLNIGFFSAEAEKEEAIFPNEIIVLAVLETHVPNEKKESLLRFINHLHNKYYSCSHLYIDEGFEKIVALNRFVLWENIDMSSLETVLQAPLSFLLDYEENFLHIMIDGEEGENTSEESAEESEQTV